MNLRILKKLSKQAAPLLKHFDHRGDVFLAKREENYIGVNIMARKHWDRGRSVHADCLSEHEIKRPARDGRGWVYMRPPSHALKGTPMVGGMSGYYEPEWDERSAWEELREMIAWSDKPATMTEAEWQRAQRIARTRPVTDEELAAWVAEDDAAAQQDWVPDEQDADLTEPAL